MQQLKYSTGTIGPLGPLGPAEPLSSLQWSHSAKHIHHISSEKFQYITRLVVAH